MNYTIGSFNLLKLNGQDNKKNEEKCREIARIIKSEKFDVVALQEVFSDAELKKSLIPALGAKKWDYRWASPKSISLSSGEGYAFVWNKDKLRLIESENSPMIYNRYSVREPNFFRINYRKIGKNALLRPPYAARFTPTGLPGGSNFEIRLINTHIIHSRPNKVESLVVNSDIKDYELRREELRILSQSIYRLFSTKRYGDNMPAYTILLGDYNLCLCGSGPKIAEEIDIDSRRKLRTVQEGKTSLKRSDSDKPQLYEEANPDLYSRNYDHFSYETGLSQKLKLEVSRVDALSKYYKNDLESYRDEVSDHVPIKLILNLKRRGN